VRLSICIPTHQGRCAPLESALESIAVQVGPDLVDEIEIVVSDNASSDGTELMISAFCERHPDLAVVYSRNELDVRLENIMRSVERASGTWCWLFGSDDLMAAGALELVLETIDAHPQATGIALGRTNFDHTMQRRAQADPPEASPSWHETTVIRGFAEIVSELAFQFGFLSANVIKREPWLEVAREIAPEALRRHPNWPQLPIFAELARRSPTWVWLPTVLVLVRGGRPYLVDGEGESPNFARVHVLLIDGLRRAWREIAGGDAVLRRALMARTLHVAASRDVVENIKLTPNQGLRWDLRLAWSCLLSFATLKSFWRDVAPILAIPAPVYRALQRAIRRRLGTMPVLMPEQCSIQLSAECPAQWWAREMPMIRCRVRNTGPVSLRSSGEHPIHVGGRWFGLDGSLVLETVRDPLPRALTTGQELELLVRTHTPWGAGRYRLELDCVQENVRWLSDADPSNAFVIEVDVELAGAAEDPA
jgi:abequosyltransferase